MNRLLTCVAVAGIAGVLFLGSTCSLLNKPPSVPEISGPTTGIVGVPVTFTATATDPEGDSIAFQFAWGDGDTSDWSALFASGETTTLSHPYADTGSYSVSARAKDQQGAEGTWSAARTVTMPAGINNCPDSVYGRLDIDNMAYRLCISPGGEMYVLHEGRPIATPIRLSDRTIYSPVELGAQGTSMAATPDGREIYIACWDLESLAVITTASRSIDRWIQLGGRPYGIAMAPDGQNVYVCLRSRDMLGVVSTAEQRVVDSVALAGDPYHVVVDPTGKSLYVTLTDIRRIQVLRVHGLSDAGKIDTETGVADLAASPDGRSLCVSSFEDSGFAVIRMADRSIAARVSIADRNLNDMAWSPSSAHLAVTHSTGTYVLSADNWLVAASLPTGAEGAAAWNPAGDTLYTASGREIAVVGLRRRW